METVPMEVQTMSSRIKTLALGGALALGFVLFLTEPGMADHDTAVLSWQGVTDPRVAGYEVWYGTKPSSLTPIKVGKVTSYSFTKLWPSTYYFAVSSYDSTGKRSATSSTVTKTVPWCIFCK